MAFEVLDEHEQSELVQKWLRENALSIAIGIAIGLLLIFGWQQWRVHKVRHEGEAAVQYRALTQAIEVKRDDDADKIAAALRKDYADTPYGTLAALRQADLAVAKGDNAGAATELEWAGQHAGDAPLKALAALRLARVRLDKGDADAALKLIDGVPKGDYPALVGELRGDALGKLGRSAEARAAYEDALSHIDPRAPNRSFVQMKLDNLPAATEKQGS